MWWTSPVLWKGVESAAIYQENGCNGAPSAANRHVWLLSLFNICFKVPLFCFHAGIWASWQKALVLCNCHLPTKQFTLKCLPTPVNKIGHLIESHAMSASLSHSLPSTTSSSQPLSALHQMCFSFLLALNKTIPASPLWAWKPLHGAWALNESHARSVCFGRQEYFEGLN